MRLFIAAQIPDKVKEKALEVASSLKNFNGVRIVKPEHMHITLAFLGRREDTAKIIFELEKIKFASFTLITKDFGFFPSQNSIRIIWLGLKESEEFFRLQHDIRTVLKHKEKFMPHITLARAREIITGDAQALKDTLKNSADEKSFREQSFEVDRFVLFSSELTPEGPIHTILRTFSAIKGEING
jgi:2'-5' RNA ligase